MVQWCQLSRVTNQIYFIGLAIINALHRLMPFGLRPLLYRVCRFDVHRNATLQGSVRFFHVGRLSVGEGSLINRGVYLDNRMGIRIGRQVSISHDAKIYTLGHDPHDENFAAKGAEVRIDDYVVVFAGAMIMPGVHLGEGSVVMAGSVVTKDVPPGRMVGGNPAQDIGERRCKPAYRLNRRYWFAH